MKQIQAPSSSSNQTVGCLGFSGNYDSTDGVLPDYISGYIRVKNIGNTLGHIKLSDSGANDVGMAFSPGETEYLYIQKPIKIVDGDFNIMY